MNTDGIIELNDLLASALSVQDPAALAAATEQLRQIEPYLAGYLENEIVVMAGKMALAGATPPLVRDLTQRVLALAVIVFQAHRLAGVRLWQESFPNSPLASLARLSTEEKPPESQSES